MPARSARLRTLAIAGAAATALLFPTVTLSGSAQATDEPTFKPQLIKVKTPSRGAKTRLQKLGLDLTEHAGHKYVEVVAHSQEELDLLTERGFTYTVEIENLIRRSM